MSWTPGWVAPARTDRRSAVEVVQHGGGRIDHIYLDDAKPVNWRVDLGARRILLQADSDTVDLVAPDTADAVALLDADNTLLLLFALDGTARAGQHIAIIIDPE